jgi:nucleolar protein 15
MRSYFTQFGEILHLRLSRNKKTGRSKHYAFIEFASSEVARIVAETMDNYLMFGHILKCKTVPREQIHENLWKGANKRFKKIPRNRIEGRKLEAAASKESWDKRVKTEEKRRKEKSQKLKAIGYEFDTPTLKTVKDIEEDIEKRDEAKLTAGGSEIDLAQGDISMREGEVPNVIAVSEDATNTEGKKAAKNIKETDAGSKKKKAKEPEALAPSTVVVGERAEASKKKKGVEKKAKASKADLDAAGTIKVDERQGGGAGKAKKSRKPKKASKKE